MRTIYSILVWYKTRYTRPPVRIDLTDTFCWINIMPREALKKAK